MGWLEWAFGWEAEVRSLVSSHLGELHIELVKVGGGDFLVELLWKHLEGWSYVAGFFWLAAVVEFNLGEHLVGERARHDERWVASGAAQVDETSLGEEDDVTAVGHLVPVDLRLDVHDRLGVGLEPGGVDFAVKVTDVADNGVVLHDFEVGWGDDAGAAGGGDEDHGSRGGRVHGGDFVAFHGGLEGVDRVNLSDDDTGAEGTERLGAALANVTVACDDGNLTGNHDVGGSLDPVKETFSAAVQVVELGLGDGVVDVDGWETESSLFEHLLQVVDTGGGLFGDAANAWEEFWVLLVDDVGKVTTVVEDHVKRLAVWEDDGGFDAPPEFFVVHALPCCTDERRRGGEAKHEKMQMGLVGSIGSRGRPSKEGRTFSFFLKKKL